MIETIMNISWIVLLVSAIVLAWSSYKQMKYENSIQCYLDKTSRGRRKKNYTDIIYCSFWGCIVSLIIILVNSF